MIDRVDLRFVAFALVVSLCAPGCRGIPLVSSNATSHDESQSETDSQEIARRRWALLSREGREAMVSGRSREAEATFIDALALVEDSEESDPRVQTTLRNLVRVASIYQRLERADDAARVMSYVDDYATLDGRDDLRARNFTAYYDSLNNQELEHAYRPTNAYLNERRNFEPTLDALIRRTARRYHVDRYLVKAIVAAESNFDALAVSKKGAQGLMQLMPATAQEMGVTTPFKPSENIRGGVRYLRGLLDRYPDLDRAIAAYNAGPVAVDRYKGVPPYPETQQYVKRVLRYYKEYRAEEGR